MQFTLSGRWKLPGLAQRALDLTFQAFAYYLIPIAIGVVSIVALVCWDSQYVTGNGDARAIRVLRETTPLSPAVANALARLAGVRLRDLPLTPERVWRALRDRRERPGGVLDLTDRQ